MVLEKGQAELAACPFSFIFRVNKKKKKYFCENISQIIEHAAAAYRWESTESKNQAKRGMIH